MTLSLDSPELKDVLASSTILRAQGEYQAAIDVIDARLAEMDADARLVAHQVALWAAEEGGLTEAAQNHARAILTVLPDHPASKRVLGM